MKAPAAIKGLLHRVELSVGSEMLDCDDIRTVGEGGEIQAGDTARPSTSAVQQPHIPCPQLSRAPNRWKWSRSTSTRFQCGATVVSTAAPLG